jgi:hypothetical protein
MSPILPDNLLDRLDGIIAFLPWFETPDFKFGHWLASRPEEPDTLIFPYFSFSDTASKFVQAAYAFGWVPQVNARPRSADVQKRADAFLWLPLQKSAQRRPLLETALEAMKTLIPTQPALQAGPLHLFHEVVFGSLALMLGDRYERRDVLRAAP